MTQEEFTDNLSAIIRKLEELQVPVGDWAWSWDNARNNGGAIQMEAAGLDPDLRMPLPAYAPDLHKVVEHSIGRLKRQFRAVLVHAARCCNPKQLAGLLRRTFANLDPVAIQKDVASMPLTCQVIAGARGSTVTDPQTQKEWPCTEGGWAPRRLR
jgi:hypothetical protein